MKTDKLRINQLSQETYEWYLAYRVIRAEKAPKFYLWGLGTGEFIRSDVMISMISLRQRRERNNASI